MPNTSRYDNSKQRFELVDKSAVSLLGCSLKSFRNEVLDGSSDVLTPLLELLLLDDKTRDSFVDKIMKRDDCELFVFFGTSFTRHLCS